MVFLVMFLFVWVFCLLHCDKVTVLIFMESNQWANRKSIFRSGYRYLRRCHPTRCLVTFSPLDAANTSPRLATGADCSESLFTQTFFGKWRLARWQMKTFHFLFSSFVKQLSHFEDFLDYCFEFQFAISATIG